MDKKEAVSVDEMKVIYIDEWKGRPAKKGLYRRGKGSFSRWPKGIPIDDLKEVCVDVSKDEQKRVSTDDVNIKIIKKFNCYKSFHYRTQVII